MLTPLERIRRYQEDWNWAIEEFRDVLPVAIDRLRLLCEEAAIRIQVEVAEDFLVAVEPMIHSIESTAEVLRTSLITVSVPISLRKIEHWPPIQSYGFDVYRLKMFSVWDPLASYGFSAIRSAEGNLSTETSEPQEGTTQYWPNGESREWLKDETVRYLERWVRFLTAESERLKSSSTATAASPQDRPEVEKPTSEAPTIEEVCNGICQTRKGKQTLKKILTLTKEGKTPVEIASRNSNTKGFSLPNISEKLKIVRERFPGFLPD